MRGRRTGVLVTMALLLSACSGGISLTEEALSSDPVAEPSERMDEIDGARESTQTAPGATATPQPTPEPREASDIDRVVSEEGDQPQTFGRLGETEAEFETDEGSVSIGDAEVPVGAGDFPVPADLDVQLASETEADLGFSGLTAMSFGELIDFYRSGVPAAGFDILREQIVDDVFATFAFESSDQTGQVAISQAPGFDGWTVIVSLGDGVGEEEQLPSANGESEE